MLSAPSAGQRNDGIDRRGRRASDWRDRVLPQRGRPNRGAACAAARQAELRLSVGVGSGKPASL